MGANLARRLVTVPTVILAWGLYSVAAPMWLAAGLLVDLLRARKGLATCRMLLFGLCFLWIEVAGLVSLGILGLLSIGSPERRTRWAYGVQGRYIAANLAAVRAAFHLGFRVVGTPPPEDVVGPLTVFVRHSSLIDVLIPGAFVANRFGLRLRYVLKKELLWEPCLDIAGHWLPNHFVDRSGKETAVELAAINRLQTGLEEGEGVILYPEGTRFSEAKRQRVLDHLDAGSPAHAQASQLKHLLPIRRGGAEILLGATPPRPVLFVGHAGLEGFSSLRDVWSGALADRTIQVRYWLEGVATIPASPHERSLWLADRWQRVDDWLDTAGRAENVDPTGGLLGHAS